MKRSSFTALILGTIGIVFFALGMCMTTIPEWGMARQGAGCGVIGLAVLLAAVMIWRKMEGKAPIKLSGKTIATTAVGVAGAMLLGIGMCLTMVLGKMILGIVIGLAGIILLLMLIPLVKGIR